MMAVHTTAPLMALADMVSGTGNIEVGRAVGGGPDCMWGWAEKQHEGCEPHHIVTAVEDDTIYWIAVTLKTLGYQVVVTRPTNPRDQTGDHEVVEEMPSLYAETHHH